MVLDIINLWEKMKKCVLKSVILLIMYMGLVVSCDQGITQENIETPIKNVIYGFKNETMDEDFFMFPQSTTTDNIDFEEKLQITWNLTNSIGILSSMGIQVAYPMGTSAGTEDTTFEGFATGLNLGSEYSVYYPYIGQSDRTKIPMIISTQVQNGNGSFSHIGKYDYMAAVNSVIGDNNDIAFNFNHLVSILHVQIQMPKAGKYSYVAIETSDKFTTEAEISLADGTLTPTKQSPLQIMRLENVELDSNEEGSVLEMYMVIHPVDLTGQVLYVKVYDEENNCYTATMQTKNFEAGTIYNFRKIAVEDLTHTGLPVTIINTPNNVDIVSKDDYVENSLITILQTDISDEFCEWMNIKGRGNTTWEAPKKPYAIKFDKKKSFFSLPEDKSWVLLANFFDKTLLRNEIAFYMGNELSTLDWTPHYQYVDLMLNGQYQGIYQFGEKVKISKGRVNIGDDGVLLEIDTKAAETDVTFSVSHIENLCNIKEPDAEYDDDTYNYAKSFVEAADEALFSEAFMDTEHGWQKYLDMDSFVDWYLINEIAKNYDAVFLTSCYMNLKRGGKLKMGPIWDFDIAFGGYPWDPQASIANTVEGFHVKNTLWYSRLFEDPAFLARVKERFNEIYAKRQKILDYIDAKAMFLSGKVVEDNRLWGTISNGDSDVSVVKTEYNNYVSDLKNWITARMEWLNTNINALTAQ